MNIIHLDVDKNLRKHLKGVVYSFPFVKENLDKINNKEEIEAISFKTQSSILDKELLEELPSLKLIITRTAGTDHINLDLCRSKNIAVYNIPDYGAYNIAEHAMALLLSLSKNIVNANIFTHQGKFSFENFLGISLKGKTLGVIGTGKIGIAFIERARGFGFKILAFDIFKNEKLAKEFDFVYVNLDELLKKSDFISIHVPLLKKTKHMIGDKEIKKMKGGVILVNTSRGQVIDEKSLIENIKKFKGLGLDVLEDEKNFSKKHLLLKFKNVIITPHCAFYTDATVKIIAKETLQNIKRFEKKDKTNRVV